MVELSLKTKKPAPQKGLALLNKEKYWAKLVSRDTFLLWVSC
jgi:hypothetical protein